MLDLVCRMNFVTFWQQEKTPKRYACDLTSVLYPQLHVSKCSVEYFTVSCQSCNYHNIGMDAFYLESDTSAEGVDFREEDSIWR